MSNYVIYYNTRKIIYRDMAKRWLKWAHTANLSEDECKGVSLFFKSIAKRFGLIEEFRSLGVICNN